MKAFFYLLGFIALPLLGRAQAPAKSAAPAKPAASAAKPAAAPAKPTLITSDTVQKPVDGPKISFSVEANPVNNSLRVRTNAKGPMQLDVNDADGRPVLTKSLLANGAALTVPLGRLPAGSYVVRCTVAEKTFMRKLTLGP